MSSRLIQLLGKIKQFFPASHFYKNFDNKNIIKMIFQQGYSCWIQNVIFARQSKNKNLWKYLQNYNLPLPDGGGAMVSALRHYGHCAGWYLSNILKKCVLYYDVCISSTILGLNLIKQKISQTCRVKIRIYCFIKIAWNKTKHYHILP